MLQSQAKGEIPRQTGYSSAGTASVFLVGVVTFLVMAWKTGTMGATDCVRDVHTVCLGGRAGCVGRSIVECC